MSVNLKQTLEGMRKVGWTAAQFMNSLNSTARTEAHAEYVRTKRVPDHTPQIDLATAEQFLRDGKGIDGPMFDVLERWAERRTSFSNIVGNVFAPPMEKQNLATISPPLLLPAEIELSEDVIPLNDITNHRAREKARGIRGTG